MFTLKRQSVIHILTVGAIDRHFTQRETTQRKSSNLNLATSQSTFTMNFNICFRYMYILDSAHFINICITDFNFEFGQPTLSWNQTIKKKESNVYHIMASGLTMQAQVAQIAKSCYHQIRNIGQIRSSITDEACKTLVHALVTARLDYANALLYGLPQTTLQRLQRVQNCAARLVSRTSLA